MRYRIVVLLLALFYVSTLTAHAYRLAFKDTAGAQRAYTFNAAVNGTVGGGGINLPVNGQIKFTASEKVNAISGGVSSITFTTKDGSLSLKLSGIPGEDQPQTLEQPLPGFTITYDRTPQGRVTNLKMNGAATELQGFPFGGPATLQSPGQGLEFPDKELKIGDTWQGTQTVAMDQGVNLTITSTYILAGTEVIDGKTYLKITGAITANVPTATLGNNPAAQPQQQNNQAQAMAMNMTINGQGTTWFNVEAGEIFRSTFKMNVSSNLAALNDIGMAMTMSIDGTMTKTN